MKAQDAGSEAERVRVRDWYRGTIGTRLDNKGEGVIISIQQRLHEDDLTSYILDAGATHLNLPAIAQHHERIATGIGSFHERNPGDLLNPERESLETLNDLRRELGSAVFVPQWLQDPTPAEGNIVRLQWFARYAEMPKRHRMLKVVQSWDTAFSAEPGSAYSVCTSWGYFDRRWYLLDVTRERLEYYDLKRRVVELYRRWKPDAVLIEKASSGEALWQDLRAEGPFLPILWPVAKSKEERLRAQTGQMEAGKIVIPDDTPWLQDYLHELKGAPSCRFWDQVDSTTQFLDFALSRQGWIDQDFDPVSGRKLRIERPDRINRR